MGKKGKVYVGTSGYNYKHWSGGVFYSRGLPQSKWFEHYAKHFNTVELNVTFYRSIKKKVYESWYKRSPANFIFVIKGNRFITHIKRLTDCEESVKYFYDSAKGLKTKFGCILWQLPPSLKVNIDRLEDFCKIIRKVIPKTVGEVFEFRHETWFCDDVYDILKKYNFCLSVAHSNRWHYVDNIVTSDFIYLRFHGGEVLYGSNYSAKELKYWADKTRKWLDTGKDTYAYFNNDAYGYAVKNALKFRELIKKNGI